MVGVAHRRLIGIFVRTPHRPEFCYDHSKRPKNTESTFLFEPSEQMKVLDSSVTKARERLSDFTSVNSIDRLEL